MAVWVVPVVAIIMGIGSAFWSVYWQHQTKRLEYEERRLMIEKGIVPAPLLPDQPRSGRWTPDDSLRRGIVMLFLGIGLGIGYYWVLHNSTLLAPQHWLQILSVGAPIVGLLGLGNIAYYIIVRSRPGSPPEA
jgi:hypothetical protein